MDGVQQMVLLLSIKDYTIGGKTQKQEKVFIFLVRMISKFWINYPVIQERVLF